MPDGRRERATAKRLASIANSVNNPVCRGGVAHASRHPPGREARTTRSDIVRVRSVRFPSLIHLGRH